MRPTIISTVQTGQRIDSKNCGLQITEAILTRGYTPSGFRVDAAHIAQRIFTVSCAITALEVTQRIAAPSGPGARVFDIAERILTQGALFAIVTLVAGMAKRIFPIGAVGDQNR